MGKKKTATEMVRDAEKMTKLAFRGAPWGGRWFNKSSDPVERESAKTAKDVIHGKDIAPGIESPYGKWGKKKKTKK